MVCTQCNKAPLRVAHRWRLTVDVVDPNDETTRVTLFGDAVQHLMGVDATSFDALLQEAPTKFPRATSKTPVFLIVRRALEAALIGETFLFTFRTQPTFRPQGEVYVSSLQPLSERTGLVARQMMSVRTNHSTMIAHFKRIIHQLNSEPLPESLEAVDSAPALHASPSKSIETPTLSKTSSSRPGQDKYWSNGVHGKEEIARMDQEMEKRRENESSGDVAKEEKDGMEKQDRAEEEIDFDVSQKDPIAHRFKAGAQRLNPADFSPIRGSHRHGFSISQLLSPEITALDDHHVDISGIWSDAPQRRSIASQALSQQDEDRAEEEPNSQVFHAPSSPCSAPRSQSQDAGASAATGYSHLSSQQNVVFPSTLPSGSTSSAFATPVAPPRRNQGFSTHVPSHGSSMANRVSDAIEMRACEDILLFLAQETQHRPRRASIAADPEDHRPLSQESISSFRWSQESILRMSQPRFSTPKSDSLALPQLLPPLPPTFATPGAAIPGQDTPESQESHGIVSPDTCQVLNDESFLHAFFASQGFSPSASGRSRPLEHHTSPKTGRGPHSMVQASSVAESGQQRRHGAGPASGRSPRSQFLGTFGASQFGSRPEPVRPLQPPPQPLQPQKLSNAQSHPVHDESMDGDDSLMRAFTASQLCSIMEEIERVQELGGEVHFQTPRRSARSSQVDSAPTPLFQATTHRKTSQAVKGPPCVAQEATLSESSPTPEEVMSQAESPRVDDMEANFSPSQESRGREKAASPSPSSQSLRESSRASQDDSAAYTPLTQCHRAIPSFDGFSPTESADSPFLQHFCRSPTSQMMVTSTPTDARYASASPDLQERIPPPPPPPQQQEQQQEQQQQQQATTASNRPGEERDGFVGEDGCDSSPFASQVAYSTKWEPASAVLGGLDLRQTKSPSKLAPSALSQSSQVSILSSLSSPLSSSSSLSGGVVEKMESYHTSAECNSDEDESHLGQESDANGQPSGRHTRRPRMLESQDSLLGDREGTSPMKERIEESQEVACVSSLRGVRSGEREREREQSPPPDLSNPVRRGKLPQPKAGLRPASSPLVSFHDECIPSTLPHSSGQALWDLSQDDLRISSQQQQQQQHLRQSGGAILTHPIANRSLLDPEIEEEWKEDEVDEEERWTDKHAAQQERDEEEEEEEEGGGGGGEEEHEHDEREHGRHNSLPGRQWPQPDFHPQSATRSGGVLTQTHNATLLHLSLTASQLGTLQRSCKMRERVQSLTQTADFSPYICASDKGSPARIDGQCIKALTFDCDEATSEKDPPCSSGASLLGGGSNLNPESQPSMALCVEAGVDDPQVSSQGEVSSGIPSSQHFGPQPCQTIASHVLSPLRASVPLSAHSNLDSGEKPQHEQHEQREHCQQQLPRRKPQGSSLNQMASGTSETTHQLSLRRSPRRPTSLKRDSSGLLANTRQTPKRKRPKNVSKSTSAAEEGVGSSTRVDGQEENPNAAGSCDPPRQLPSSAHVQDEDSREAPLRDEVVIERTHEGREDTGQDLYEVEKVCGYKVEKQHRAYQVLFEIKWQGYPESDNTFEPISHLNRKARDAFQDIITSGQKALEEKRTEEKDRRRSSLGCKDASPRTSRAKRGSLSASRQTGEGKDLASPAFPSERSTKERIKSKKKHRSPLSFSTTGQLRSVRRRSGRLTDEALTPQSIATRERQCPVCGDMLVAQAFSEHVEHCCANLQ